MIPPPPQARLARLDGLRGLAALAVVLFHYTAQFPNFVPGGLVPFTFDAGAYGVHLFFMISGFVILMSIAQRGTGHFARSRFIRLYPVFWAAVLLTSLVLTINPLLGPGPTPLQLLANLTMFEQYAHIEPIDGAYWSLSYELGFYIMMFALFASPLHRWIGWLPTWMTLGAAAFPIIGWAIPHPLHLMIGISSYSHLFAAGLALYLGRTEGFSARHVAVLVLVPLVQGLHDGLTGALIVAVAVLAMIWGTAPGRQLPRAAAWLTGLGAISYALYLIHQMIGYVVLAQLEAAGLGAWAALLLTVAVALALASVLTWAIEKPAAHWLGRVLPRLGERTAPRGDLADG
ncbi:acyltransferase family protein [Aurantiacibacter suaedae]|uniref:acyltransferase family protein n=1 Tax=Aurantiacibacter suaedae TaxID=2545755 RepID=UPI001386DF69|nr:acyltransferase [Aurantiacibacter suaedae]